MKRSDITDHMVCEAYRDKHGAGLFADALLMNRCKAPGKVVTAAINRAYFRGLIDGGVSLRTGWLTEKGMALLSGSTCETQPAADHR